MFSEDVLDNGNNSAPVEIGTDHIVVLHLLDRKEATLQPLDAVKEQIGSLLKDEKARMLAETKGQVILGDLQGSATVTMESVAAAESLEIQEAPLINRNASEPAAAIVATAFAADEPTTDQPVYEGVLSASGDYIIIALDEVKAGDFSALPPVAREQLWANLNKVHGAAEMAAVLSILKAQASINITSQTDQ